MPPLEHMTHSVPVFPYECLSFLHSLTSGQSPNRWVTARWCQINRDPGGKHTNKSKGMLTCIRGYKARANRVQNTDLFLISQRGAVNLRLAKVARPVHGQRPREATYFHFGLMVDELRLPRPPSSSQEKTIPCFRIRP